MRTGIIVDFFYTKRSGNDLNDYTEIKFIMIVVSTSLCWLGWLCWLGCSKLFQKCEDEILYPKAATVQDTPSKIGNSSSLFDSSQRRVNSMIIKTLPHMINTYTKIGLGYSNCRSWFNTFVAFKMERTQNNSEIKLEGCNGFTYT